ncbi:hypothetical protein [Halomicroarcula sp. GCM10025743]|uniref:hypothetical protein n=1 Tax=Halomicroarcula sp. GCM10025743 TaxID=3252671 RepID=UPI0036D33CE3
MADGERELLENFGSVATERTDGDTHYLTAFDRGERDLIRLHNLADVRRTRRLALLASEFVPRSECRVNDRGSPGRSRRAGRRTAGVPCPSVGARRHRL